MAEDLNIYFSSVSNKNDISYQFQLIVTPETVGKKIKEMNNKKSPGVDGIPQKLLMETVEQISIPLVIKIGSFLMERSKHLTISYVF